MASTAAIAYTKALHLRSICRLKKSGFHSAPERRLSPPHLRWRVQGWTCRGILPQAALLCSRVYPRCCPCSRRMCRRFVSSFQELRHSRTDWSSVGHGRGDESLIPTDRRKQRSLPRMRICIPGGRLQLAALCRVTAYTFLTTNWGRSRAAKWAKSASAARVWRADTWDFPKKRGRGSCRIHLHPRVALARGCTARATWAASMPRAISSSQAARTHR